MLYKQYFTDFMAEIERSLDVNMIEDFVGFKEQLDQKMTIGHQEHGDGVFSRHPAEIMAEMKMEAMDLAGWGLVLWVILNEKIKDNPQQAAKYELMKQQVMEYAHQGFELWLSMKQLKQEMEDTI